MNDEILVIDAFTDKPFAGNPAAVYILDTPIPDDRMRLIAREMNLSETAFVAPNPDGSYNLRWFTPAIEIDLCGHATLASAHALWQTGALPTDRPARFHTHSGLLTCIKSGDWITMDFPAQPPTETAPPEDVISAIPAAAKYIGFAKPAKWLVELENEDAVRDVTPRFEYLKDLGAGVIVTAKSTGEPFDFISRYFASYAGVDEDPVTGSAHCVLAPYWAAKLGKDAMVGYQASARGGIVKVEASGERVMLSGQAVTVSRVRLLV